MPQYLKVYLFPSSNPVANVMEKMILYYFGRSKLRFLKSSYKKLEEDVNKKLISDICKVKTLSFH